MNAFRSTMTPLTDLADLSTHLFDASMRLAVQFSHNVEKVASMQVETVNEVHRRQAEISNLVIDESLKAARILRNHCESLFNRAIDRQAQTGTDR
ncbi:MAG TPA: hypothetical protein PLU72_01680 [Candidatus Ozemobacteraceae bacterium]|nr:hypothetical protein [Candidatus Ozemobacteraceae bacterium]